MQLLTGLSADLQHTVMTSFTPAEGTRNLNARFVAIFEQAEDPHLKIA